MRAAESLAALLLNAPSSTTGRGGGEAHGRRHFHHEADIGVRGLGATKEAAFENAACALTAVIAPPERVQVLHSIEMACSAPDGELLLVDG